MRYHNNHMTKIGVGDEMKFWTIQTKTVLEAIMKEGFFQPDFKKSGCLYTNPNLSTLYYMVLESFNKSNNVNLPGVIFSFLGSDNQSIFPLEDIYQFHDFMNAKRPAIQSLWNQFLQNDSVILELDYSENFNPVFIDLNDFQFLMPPVMMVKPYTVQDVSRICQDICSGEIYPSIFPSGVIQAHLPYIKAEHIVHVYPMFPLGE